MKELPKAYQPADYEDTLYAAWEQAGYFKPASDHTKAAAKHRPYTIIMPPPNATGILHTGHAIMIALEDALIRYHRMKGFDTLYVPGTDHAAIATASKVDQQLVANGVDKQQLGRTKYAEQAKDFALQNKSTIENQIKGLGASADWSRNAFTMDEPREEAVRIAFRQLYEKGLVYRGDYMVNWCPHCRTVLSDDEVEHKDQEGVLYYMHYGPFEIATTRPETKVGDTAVAVHPNDKRYKKYHGQTVDVQTINGVRQLRVITDEMVDPTFGTGVVKITPFHDKNDYAVYERQPEVAGPPLEVIGEDGRMTAAAGKKLSGKDRFAARKSMVEWLKQENLLVKEELHQNSVGRCYRCDTVIEPRISKQWFINVDKIKQQAIQFVEDGDLKFVPARFEKTYLDWFERLHDWCISRQIWFGHPVPVYIKGDEVSLDPKPGFEPSTDTLDTWFSSGLWPFSTMGWPDEDSSDFKRFFPGDVLETGYDIILFWIVRMVVMTVGLDVRDPNTGKLKPPFHTAYLHGLVRDKKGRKFSKTLGNGVDPLELIGQYGADALRFMLITAGTPGVDIKFDEERVVGARNFANKLWNIARFIIAQEPKSGDLSKLQAETLTTFDRAILHELHHTAVEVEGCFYDYAAYEKSGDSPRPAPQFSESSHASYDLGRAGNRLQQFIWSDFADWYVEAAKVQLKHKDMHANTLIILRYTLESVLRMLHPLMPFITETLWQDGLGHKKALIISEWPALHENLDQPEDAARYAAIKEIVETIRRLRTENGTPPGAWIQALLVTDEPGWLLQNADVINALARLKMLRVRVDAPTEAERAESVITVVDDVTVVLPMAGLIDSDVEQKRLEQEVAAAGQEVANLEKRLNNKEYVNRAPAQVVAQTRQKLTEANAREAKLRHQLEQR